MFLGLRARRGPWQWLADRPWRALALAVVLACAFRLPFVAEPFGDDEGGYLYVAQHWPGPGHWLYGGQWVDRPPVLVLVFKLVALLGGTPVAMRLVAMVLVSALVVAAWCAGRRLAGGDGAVAAALTAAALGSDPAIVGDELVSDSIGATFVMVSVALLLAAIHRGEQPRTASRGDGLVPLALAGLAGVAGVLAFLSKQSALVAMVVAALLLGARLGRRWPLLLAYAGGVLVPLAATVAWAAAGPGLGMLVDATYTFRVAAAHLVAASASRAPAARRGVFVHVMLASGMVLPLAQLGYDLLTRRGAWRLRVAVLVAAGCLAAVIVASLNWFTYYWLAVVPLAAMGSAIAFVPGRRPRWAPMVPRLVVAGTVAVVAANVVTRLPVRATEPLASRFVAAAARPHDTMVVVWGRPNLMEDAGLSTPYPYSWTLPLRVEDPRLRLFARTLAGPQAPTWLLEVGHLNEWGLGSPQVARLVARRYHLAAVVCGHDVLLRDGVPRPVAAARAGLAGARCGGVSSG